MPSEEIISGHSLSGFKRKLYLRLRDVWGFVWANFRFLPFPVLASETVKWKSVMWSQFCSSFRQVTSARSDVDHRRSPGTEGVLCAIICPLILTPDPCRGPIGDLKNLGRHSRYGTERCNSRWRPRWPPHPYIQYNSICICLGVMNLVSLPRFLGPRNPLK